MNNLAFSPAAERNRAPIWSALSQIIKTLSQAERQTDDQELETPLHLLEIASGSGQHAAYFASQHGALRVYPTDLTLERAQSVAGWARESDVSDRVAPLQLLDASSPTSTWPSVDPHIIYLSLIHI